MSKLIKKITILILPFSICIFFFFSVGFYAGELKDYDTMFQNQRKNREMLLGVGYSENTAHYKLANCQYYEPSIIALGTSRVMQFKSDYFIDGIFYNCGGAVAGNYDEYLNFLKNMDDAVLPEVVILGLDTWVFNDNWNKTCTDYVGFEKIEKENLPVGFIVKSIFEDYIDRKWSVGELDNFPNNQGFNGKIKNTGYMWDGSYYYGELYEFPEEGADFNFLDTYKRIEAGNSRFEYGDCIDSDTMLKLDSLLCYCKEEGIYVIGFIPPFAPAINDALYANGNYGYIDLIAPKCENLFNQYAFEFYDYSSVQQLGCKDDYFLDGFHGSEIVYGMIVQDMIEHRSIVGQYVKQEKLKNMLANRESDVIFFGATGKGEK